MKKKKNTRSAGRPKSDDAERLIYLSVGLPPALRDKIIQYAWDKHKRVAGVIREILMTHFAGDLVGRVDESRPHRKTH